MALWRINRGEVGQAIARLLGLKGEYTTELESSLVPTLQIANLVDSPYMAASFSRACGTGGAVVAVALKNAWVIARPGLNVALQVKQVLIGNPEAAAQTVLVQLLTRTQVAALALAGVGQMFMMANGEVGISAPSQINTGTFNSGTVGVNIFSVTIPAGQSIIWTPPDPGVVLLGNDPGGIPGLGVLAEAQNLGVRAVFSCREWPLPG